MTQHDHGAEPRPTRRTLVRAGAHAAWAVPAVVVVGAAPAFAAVSGPHLVLSNGTASRSGTTVSLALSILNDGSMRTVNSFDVVVDILATKNIKGSTATASSAATAPTFGVPTGGNVTGQTGNQDRRLTYTSSGRLLPGDSTDLTSTVTLLQGDGSASPSTVTISSVTVTFVPGNGGATTTYPVTVTGP